MLCNPTPTVMKFKNFNRWKPYCVTNYSPALSMCFSQPASTQVLRKISSASTSCNRSSALDTFEHRPLSLTSAGFIFWLQLQHTQETVTPVKLQTVSTERPQISGKKNSKRLRESLISIFLPVHEEHYIWVTVWSPDPLQLWEVTVKQKRCRGDLGGVSLFKRTLKVLYFYHLRKGNERSEKNKTKGLNKRIMYKKQDFSVALSTVGLERRTWYKLQVCLSMVMEDLKKKKNNHLCKMK